MRTGEQVKLDIGSPAAEAFSKGRHHIQRIKLVLVARDMQNSSADGLVFFFFPVARDAAAYSDYAAHLAGICGGKAVVKPHWLRKAQ